MRRVIDLGLGTRVAGIFQRLLGGADVVARVALGVGEPRHYRTAALWVSPRSLCCPVCRPACRGCSVNVCTRVPEANQVSCVGDEGLACGRRFGDFEAHAVHLVAVEQDVGRVGAVVFEVQVVEVDH